MSRRVQFSVVWILVFTCAARAQSPRPVGPRTPSRQSNEVRDSRALEEEGRRLAAQILNGRNLVLRVYPDARHKPEWFVKVGISLVGDRIQSKAIRAGYPSISDLAVVVAWAQDQDDPAVATVLDRCVYAERYFENYERSLWDLISRRRRLQPVWTFVDAQNKPIPGASVEILLEINMAEIPLGRMTLDEQGQTPRLFSGAMFILKVEHPEYGAAFVEYMHSEEDPSGVYTVPLVRLDSEGVAVSVHGTVVDTDGNPVADAVVDCSGLSKPDGGSEFLHPRIRGRAVTNDQGWFALCMPVMTEKHEPKGLPIPGTMYLLSIEPPKTSNLRRPDPYHPIRALAGTQQTFTLARMDTQQFFHTFSFEYLEGPITDPQELRKIDLTLRRDGREWARLPYEQWKNGCSLPLGTLSARTTRWGDSFSFDEIKLGPDGPEHLVIKARPPIVYRGRVVNGITGEPMTDVLVLAAHRFQLTDPCSLTDEQWRQLRDEAARQAADRTPQALYQRRGRVVATRADGTFELTFLPGYNTQLFGFTAMAPGYCPSPGSGDRLLPGPGNTGAVTTIRLMPVDYRSQLPILVFEDEAGPVTDPNQLDRIRLQIDTGGGMIRSLTWHAYAREPEFIAGIYSAEVVWDDKRYIFEPVDLTDVRPQTVVFHPRRIERIEVTYTGQVVHGITGAPIAGAVVICGLPMNATDASRLSAEDWATIRSRGPKMDTGDPNLAPLTSLFARLSPPGREVVQRMTQTDSNGRYSLSYRWDGQVPVSELLVFAQDFLRVRQQLALLVRPNGDKSRRPVHERLAADENGVVAIQPLKLFPAATVIIHPVMTDPGHADSKHNLRLAWTIDDENKPLWVQDLLGTPGSNRGASVLRVYDLQPNATQTQHVPAGVNLKVTLQLLRSQVPPMFFNDIRLAQGQVKDLGRVELRPGISVVVKVVDSAGRPVRGIRIDCAYEDGSQWMFMEPTDSQGMVTLGVPAHSSGTFGTTHYDKQTETLTAETIPYKVGGAEDSGCEFVLRLSDAFVKQLLDSRASR